MAGAPNLNAPSGLTPARPGPGSAAGRVNNRSDYSLAGGLASNIFRGSLVKPTGTGNNIDVVAAGANPSIGVFKGVNYVDAGGNTQFRPYWGSGQTVLAGSVPEVSVYDDPDQLFDAQVSGTAGLVASNIGNTANILIGVGSQLTGTSADQVDQSTFSASATNQQLQVLQLRQSTNNNFGQFARAIVSIFLHYANGLVTPY
jgi:hypothetical protein